MTFSIRVDDETGIATVTYSGVVRVDDARESAVAFWKAPGWSGHAAAWDFRTAEFDLSSSDVQDMARFILRSQPTPPPAKIAFVTGRDVDFGLARMFEVYRKSPDTAFRVFRCYDDAMTWLGV